MWRATVGRNAHVRWGNLRRTAPFGLQWGAERGLPVDRRYIEDFLQLHAADIRGQALEIHGTEYIDRYGGGRVEQAHVLDINTGNARATVVGDLSQPGTLPEGGFDCFILTQTLQFIRDAGPAAANAYRCLAPGGVLLITVPTTSRLERGYDDFWRWTPRGLEELLADSLPTEAERTVTAYGNVLTAVAFLLGLAAQDLSAEEYAVRDPLYPMLVCARVRRPA